MKRILNLTLAVLLSLTANAQTKADSLRADSIYKSMELQGVEVGLTTRKVTRLFSPIATSPRS